MPPDDVGLGLEREAAEAAAGERLAGRPSAACRAAKARRPRACRRSSASAAGSQMPSKASLSGAPLRRSLMPERSPASAAAKSVRLMEASIGSPCQAKRPVAAKLLEIDGQASASSTSVKRLGDAARGVVARRWCRRSIRISENEVASVRPVGLRTERARQRVDQRRPVRAAVLAEHHVDARPHQRDVGDLDAAGEQREEPQPRGQALGRERRARCRRRARHWRS